MYFQILCIWLFPKLFVIGVAQLAIELSLRVCASPRFCKCCLLSSLLKFHHSLWSLARNSLQLPLIKRARKSLLLICMGPLLFKISHLVMFWMTIVLQIFLGLLLLHLLLLNLGIHTCSHCLFWLIDLCLLSAPVLL